MAASNVLRDYLVNLGFKVDAKSLASFNKTLSEVGRNALKIAKVVGGAATAVAGGVTLFAESMEDLYFASKKSKSSADNIKAFTQTAANFGASAGEALESIQSLARFMRETPGSEGFLSGLGVQTRDVNGNLRDTSDILVDIGKELAKKPYATAKQYGDLLGISEDTLRAIQSGEFETALKKQKTMLENAGFKKATEDAHQFMVQVRALTTQLEVFAVQIQKAILEKFGMSIEQVGAWMQKNGPAIAERVAEVVKVFLELGEKVVPALIWLGETLVDLDNKTDGWSTKLLAALAVLQLLGGTAVLSGIVGLVKALTSLGAAAATAEAATAGAVAGGAAAGGGLFALLGKLGLLGAAGAGGYMAGTKLNEWLESQLGTSVGSWLYDKVHGAPATGSQTSPATSTTSSSLQASATPSSLKRGERNNNPGNLNFAGQAGAELEGPGGRFARFNTAQEGLNALSRQLSLYASRGMDTVKSIISTYAPSSENKTGAYINFVSKSMGVGSTDKLNLKDPAVMSKMMDAIIQMEQGRNIYGQQQLLAASGAKEGVQIAQETNIYVQGGDATSTGRSVASEQDKVNRNLARHVQSGIS